MRISDWSSDGCSSDLDTTRTLTVNIPAGVDEGTRIRLSGEGEAGARGAPAGDLYIFIHVARHPLFDREGTTLYARAPLSFPPAALGGVLEIPNPDGAPYQVTIPTGIPSGRELRHRGAGMTGRSERRTVGDEGVSTGRF